MNAKDMTHRVIFEKKTVEEDIHGESIEVFTHFATKFAKAEPITLDKQDENEVIYQVNSIELSIRYSPLLKQQIKTGDRVLFDKNYYRIDSVNGGLDRKSMSFTLIAYE